MRRLRDRDLLFLLHRQLVLVHVRVSIRVCPVRHRHHYCASSFCREITVTKLSHRQELIQVVPLHHASQIWFFASIWVEISDVPVVSLLDEPPVVTADVRAVAFGFSCETLEERGGRDGMSGWDDSEQIVWLSSSRES